MLSMELFHPAFEDSPSLRKTSAARHASVPSTCDFTSFEQSTWRLDEPTYNSTLVAVSMVSCRSLNLRSNLLTGPIPSDFSSMTALTWLMLTNNSLSGTLPSQLASNTVLK